MKGAGKVVMVIGILIAITVVLTSVMYVTVQNISSQNTGGINYHGRAYPQAAVDSATAWPDVEHGTDGFVLAGENNLSTFAADVDTASYTLMRKYVEGGSLPPTEMVRAEEFINYFDHQYPSHTGDTFKVYPELAGSRFGDDGMLMLRLGIKGKDVPIEDRKPAKLVFVVDCSGSMASEDRIGLVKQSLVELLENLEDGDEIGIVRYNEQAEAVLQPTTLENIETINTAIQGLEAGGSTNADAGLTMGYEMAAENYDPDANNRVILLTDGVANTGETSPEAMLDNVEGYRDIGIFLSCFGFGMHTYNDPLMEELADNGDGQYAYIDSITEARRVFNEQLTGTLQAIAKDVKIQVGFNSDIVHRFRLVGYENRLMTEEEFDDEEADAGEVGAGHSVTALYELELEDGAGSGALCSVTIRWIDIDNGENMETRTEIANTATSFDAASARFRLTLAVAEFAEILGDNEFAGGSTIEDVLETAEDALDDIDEPTEMDTEFVELVRLAKGIKCGSAPTTV